jgi:hypothetical protein
MRTEEALSVFEDGVRALPLSVVLHATFADALCSDLRATGRTQRGHELYKGLIQRLRQNGLENQCCVAYALYLRWARFSSPHTGVEDARKIYADALVEDPQRRVVLGPTMAEIELCVSHDPTSALALYSALTPEEQREVHSPYVNLLVLQGEYDSALQLLSTLQQSTDIQNQIIMTEREKDFISVYPHLTSDNCNVLLSEELLFPNEDPMGTVYTLPPPSAIVDKMESPMAAHANPYHRDVQNMFMIRSSTLIPFRAVAGEARPVPNTTFVMPIKTVTEEAERPEDGEVYEKSKELPKPKSVYVYYAQSRNRKRPRDPLAALPKPIQRLLFGLPAPIGCVGIMEPLLQSVPNVPFLMQQLQTMAPPTSTA